MRQQKTHRALHSGWSVAQEIMRESVPHSWLVIAGAAAFTFATSGQGCSSVRDESAQAAVVRPSLRADAPDCVIYLRKGDRLLAGNLIEKSRIWFIESRDEINVADASSATLQAYLAQAVMRINATGEDGQTNFAEPNIFALQDARFVSARVQEQLLAEIMTEGAAVVVCEHLRAADKQECDRLLQLIHQLVVGR